MYDTRRATFAALTILSCGCCLAVAQTPLSTKLYTAQGMWADISADVRKHYYDPKFHGLDWDQTTRDTKQAIENSTSINMAMSRLAAALDSLNDSHTFFIPPPRPYRHDYGWQMQVVGGHCYVTRVRPGLDAETKGMKPGDEVLSVNGFVPARDTLWRIQYVFGALRPQESLRVGLRTRDGDAREVEIAAKIQQFGHIRAENEEHALRPRDAEVGNGILLVKLPAFILSEGEIGAVIGKARKHDVLILDLRGNPGGTTDTLKLFVGCMFDHDVKIGDRVGREEKKPMIAKSRHHFDGKLTVLVDSRSASAAELFARVMQIEKRGTLLGDVTSGSVMEAKEHGYQLGLNTAVFFGASITDADITMTDGKSLEHVGVTPDEILLPSSADLASGRDPVLSRAVELAGGNLTPEDAGKLFPYEWPKH